jgi:hypothetical protein
LPPLTTPLPILPLILRCGAKRSLEGGLQKPRRSLEPSFEARWRGHLRMKVVVG